MVKTLENLMRNYFFRDVETFLKNIVKEFDFEVTCEHIYTSLASGISFHRSIKGESISLHHIGTCVCGITGSASARRLGGYGFNSHPNRVRTKDVKNCTYCCYVRCATLIVWEGGMPWPKTGATQYHAQLGLPDKGHSIKV